MFISLIRYLLSSLILRNFLVLLWYSFFFKLFFHFSLLGGINFLYSEEAAVFFFFQSHDYFPIEHFCSFRCLSFVFFSLQPTNIFQSSILAVDYYQYYYYYITSCKFFTLVLADGLSLESG